MNRRQLLKFGAGAILGLAGSSALISCSSANIRKKKSSVPRAVVVGGGSGGLSVAHAIKKNDPSIEVIVLERNSQYVTCYGSNWTLSDLVGMNDITFDYKNLQKHAIQMVQAEVSGVDAEKKQVLLQGGDAIEYDRLIVSPGISFRWDQIEGLDESTTTEIPHAWKAGEQTEILKRQINSMPEDGTFVMVAPPNPFRCPPGPYERASMVATYFKQKKPKAKLLILDAKDEFSKMKLFKAGWEKHYSFGSDNAMIEWISNFEGGTVKAVDPKTKTVTTNDGDKIRADVVNYIPTQKANVTADKMGLVDASGWCSIDPETFESKQVANIHVLGDSSFSSMAKSGFAANSQGNLCGVAVAKLLTGKEPNPSPSLFNQCFSLVTPDYGISVLDTFQVKNHEVKRTGGGLFPKDGNFTSEADAARAWYANITGALFK